jgi:hypothetical protein
MDFICEQINLPVKILELDFIERIIFIEEILLNNLNEQSIKKERTFELNSKFHKTYKHFFQSLITISY